MVQPQKPRPEEGQARNREEQTLSHRSPPGAACTSEVPGSRPGPSRSGRPRYRKSARSATTPLALSQGAILSARAGGDGKVPQTHGPVTASGSESPPIGAEGDGTTAQAKGRKDRLLLAGSDLPEADV